MQPKSPTKHLEFLGATIFTQTKICCDDILFITPTKGVRNSKNLAHVVGC